MRRLLVGLRVCALLVLAVFGVATARAFWSARTELRQARAAERSGELDLAIAYYRRAAGWVAPFNTAATDARRALAGLARAADARGERERALSAYRGLRASFARSRTLWGTPRAAVAPYEARIATLMAEEPGKKGDSRRDRRARRERYLRGLVSTEQLSPLGVSLALGGLFTWVGAVAFAVTRGLDAQGKPVRRTLWLGALGLVAGLAAFALGLRIA